MRRPLLPCLAALAALAVPAAAQAGEPVMPLEEVTAGLQCTGASVVRGTDVSTFGVEVLDVVAGDRAGGGARILFRVSGPAVDATGIGPGFSGSPIRCTRPDGTVAIAGAISEGIGEFGGKVGLATPIAEVLGEPVDPPAAATRDAALLRRARPLAGPLTFSGVSGPVARALTRAGRKAGRPVYAAPAAPRQAAAQAAAAPLVPGSAMAAGIAHGDLTASSVGTVAYVDGDRVWGFGHPLDGAGRRALFLQGAYVHTVVNNPVATEETTTYKLASPVGLLGTLTNDAPDAVAGRLGVLPSRFDLVVRARDVDTGAARGSTTTIADEQALGTPTGVSSLSQVAPVALAQAAYEVLRGSPARQGGELCVRVVVRERPKPLRFCNTYAGGGGPEAPAAPAVADLTNAVGLLDSYKLGTLTPTRVEVNLKVRRGLHQAYLTKVTGPTVVRRGSTYRFTVTARRVGGGAAVVRRVRIRIPKDIPTGERVLTLTGTPADAGGEDDGALVLDLGDEEETSEDDPGPRSVADLAAAFAGLARFDGVTVSFRQPGAPTVEDLEDPQPGDGAGYRERRAFGAQDGLRLSGTTRKGVLVVPARKRR